MVVLYETVHIITLEVKELKVIHTVYSLLINGSMSIIL